MKDKKTSTTSKSGTRGKTAASKKTTSKATGAKKTTKSSPVAASKKGVSENVENQIDQTQKAEASPTVKFTTRISDYDVHLLREGRHFKLYEKLGSFPMELDGEQGTYFAVWAPSAKKVSVVGNFNGWNRDSHVLMVRFDSSGIWEGFIPNVNKGEVYKYFILSNNDYSVEKGDPFALHWEVPPNTASIVWDREFKWNDKKWMEERKSTTGQSRPFSVYEIHFGSWRRVPEDGGRPLTYREMASQLPEYLNEMGFTHVEFLPIMEHPFYGSWGYQVTGYFAPTSRYGTPQDFMYLIDALHSAGIGVILDWVPSHFPSDQHGLSYFDGTHLFEHQDPRKGYHPDWNSYIFNYNRNEVRSFLISNALYWLDLYHADGLRVDAVASMLYLDYSRKEGEWIPNEYGGRENLEAISLLKQFNEAVHLEFPDVYTIAEESTAWPMVSKPTYLGGLGFDMKWMMGWMHDSLEYFSKDPVYRQYHQNEITFSIIYAFTEQFMLPLSHDEVVHGKNSLIYKMPGDEWQQFANLRLLYGYMYAHPGGKLLFMGSEFGQTHEWKHEGSLDWHLLQYGNHSGVSEMMKAVNKVYKNEKALYELPFDEAGFEWIDINDSSNSVISFIRKGKDERERIVVVCNFTPHPHYDYKIGVSHGGFYDEIFNSDSSQFGGSNCLNGSREAYQAESHGRPFSLSVNLPPLGTSFMKLRS